MHSRSKELPLYKNGHHGWQQEEQLLYCAEWADTILYRIRAMPFFLLASPWPGSERGASSLCLYFGWRTVLHAYCQGSDAQEKKARKTWPSGLVILTFPRATRLRRGPAVDGSLAAPPGW